MTEKHTPHPPPGVFSSTPSLQLGAKEYNINAFSQNWVISSLFLIFDMSLGKCSVLKLTEPEFF